MIDDLLFPFLVILVVVVAQGPVLWQEMKATSTPMDFGFVVPWLKQAALFVVFVAALVGLALVLSGSASAFHGLFVLKREMEERVERLAHLEDVCECLERANKHLHSDLEGCEVRLQQKEYELKKLGERKDTERVDHSVRISGEDPLYWDDELSEDDRGYLLSQRYERHKFVGIDSPGPKVWWIKGSAHESAEHYFLVHRIAEYLRTKTWGVDLFETRGPDVVFESVQGEKVAVEIETGSHLRSDKKKFEEKIRTLREEFGSRWMIVVTHSDLLKKYRKYGPTYTKGQVKRALEKYFE